MPVDTVELYTDEDMAGLKRKIKCWMIALCAVAAAALAACITVAAITNTGNAERMELYAVVISTLAGWVIIYCATYVIGNARRELGHAGTLRSDERERVEGRVTVTRRWLRIKKSITAREVEVETPEGVSRFWVAESRAGQLARANATALYTSHGYVAAYEVMK